MANKKLARAATGYTPEEQDVLDRANTVERARLAATGGKSLLDQMWDELDSIVRDLMADWPDTALRDITKAQALDWGELRGEAKGVAYCIALVTHSTQRDVDAVRAEAMRRYHAAEEAPRKKPKRTKIV